MSSNSYQSTTPALAHREAQKSPILSVSINFSGFFDVPNQSVLFTRYASPKDYRGRFFVNPTRSSLKRLERALDVSNWPNKVELEKFNVYVIWFHPFVRALEVSQ